MLRAWHSLNLVRYCYTVSEVKHGDDATDSVSGTTKNYCERSGRMEEVPQSVE